MAPGDLRHILWCVVLLFGAASCGPPDGSPDGSDCAAAIPIGFDTVLSGTTRGRANVQDAYCTDTPSGPDVYYRVVAPHAGRLRVQLTSSARLMMLVMDHCEDEVVACAGPAPVDVSGTLRAGEERYIVVSGETADDEGDFTLSFEPSLCGNGVRDNEDEACDGSDVGNLTCADFEFASGNLACTAECLIDIKQCRDGY